MTPRAALFWIAAACCVVAQAAILWSIVFGRASKAPAIAARPGRRTVEIAWAVIPAVGLALVLYLTWLAVDASGSPAADAIRIDAHRGE